MADANAGGVGARGEAGIRRVRAASRAEWAATFRDCEYATYFQGPEWAELWSEYQPASRPAPRLVEFHDGLRALLPLSRTRVYKGLMSSFVSSPAGTFGGWLSTDALGAPHARALARHLRSLPELNWRLNPYDPNLEHIDLAGSRPDETHVIALPADFAENFRSWSKGARAAVKQSAREGVTVRLADGEADWRAYYEVYLDSVRRWGERAGARYDWSLFGALAGRRSEAVRLWLAEHEGNVIGGALCLYARRHVVYWHGAALEANFKLRPVNSLMHACIQDACAREFRWFDFNPSGGHAGVAAFKRGFGTEARPAPVISSRSRWGRVVHGAAVAYAYAKRAPGMLRGRTDASDAREAGL